MTLQHAHTLVADAIGEPMFFIVVLLGGGFPFWALLAH